MVPAEKAARLTATRGSLERGFLRLAVVLSAGGLGGGLLMFRYTYVRDEWHVMADLGSWVSCIIALTAWPWIAFYAARWVVRGFRSN